MCVCMQVPPSADGTHAPRGVVFARGQSVFEVLSLQRAT